MIGLRTKSIFLLVASLFLLGCTKLFIKEIPFVFRTILENGTASNLYVTRKSGGFDPDEDLSRTTFELQPGINDLFGLISLETNNPVIDFLSGWGRNNRFRIYKNDTLVVDWRGPAYFGGAEEHHFYNIDAWEVDDTPQSFNVVYTITFTIRPEDLEQGNPP